MARFSSMHAAAGEGYGNAMPQTHDPLHEPDDIDPTNQSGRPVMVTGAVVGIILALALLAAVYFYVR
jgi:hypothetical protein